ncbi:S1 family peptidase [Streptomyces sp. JJ36]|uniref:S1 family peptidase n=1 Tax=Streptomyces sp. JJ36 TaxID=2736645 RepID=UPI001F232B49|nr:S1 family peptidase [Streptomyces sp. JJ36]MCF6521507.1 S1 family peptidase [Streptomyces sp. JJ36]
MHRRNRVRLGLALALAAGLGLTGAGTPASASGSDAPEASPGLVTALQRDLGLDEEAARTRLRQEADARQVRDAARDAAGGAFGGAWFDADSGRLVVGVAADGPEARERRAAVREAGATPTSVPHTAAELDAAKQRLDSRARDRRVPEGVQGWHVDPRSSTVVVSVERGAADDPKVRAFLRATGPGSPVTVDATEGEAPRTFAAGVVGGDPYYINGNTRCSIGFSVHGGFVTAGHCGGVGSSVTGWDGSAMGHFEQSAFPGDDMAFVRTGHGWWTVPVVLGWGTVPDRLVRGSAEAPVGSSICRSGSTTHWHCGTVLGKNQTVVYNGDTYVHGLTKTSVCAEPGDSGGSYITGDQAQGVTSGGWGNCSSGGETWFQPVNEILQRYGLTLHTQ